MKYFIYVSLLGLISSSIFLSSDNYKKEEQNNSKIVLQLDDYISVVRAMGIFTWM